MSLQEIEENCKLIVSLGTRTVKSECEPYLCAVSARFLKSVEELSGCGVIQKHDIFYHRVFLV